MFRVYLLEALDAKSRQLLNSAFESGYHIAEMFRLEEDKFLFVLHKGSSDCEFGVDGDEN